MKVDTTRYFPVPERVTPLSNLQCNETARSLARRCWHHYEEGGRGEPHYGTVYCGGLGPCSYLRLRLATAATDCSGTKEDFPPHDLFRDALQAADAALRQGARKEVRCTLLECRTVGALAMKCAALASMGRQDEARSAADEILRIGQSCRSPIECLGESECEILYGRSGYLQALLFVRTYLPGDDASTYGQDVAVDTISTIIETGERTSRLHHSSLSLLWEWHESLYLGAAHGVVGILFTLLHFMPELRIVGEQMKRDVIQLVRTAVDGLEELCFESGNLPSSIGRENDKLVHWCHGAPGYVLLLVKAFEVFDEELYLRRAEEVARNVIFPRGLLHKGVGLCHGISGNAYCFLAVHRARLLEQSRKVKGSPSGAGCDEDDEWIQMARFFASFAIEKLPEFEKVPDRPYSLFEGSAGLAVLLLDLGNPQDARFPCYEF